MKNFKQAFAKLLADHPEWGMKLSGVACVVQQNNTVFYSASVVPPKTMPKTLPPNSFTKRFQPAVVSGFKYIKIQCLEFDSELSLPTPNWRIQVLYQM